jgi:hypothetical protein
VRALAPGHLGAGGAAAAGGGGGARRGYAVNPKPAHGPFAVPSPRRSDISLDPLRFHSGGGDPLEPPKPAITGGTGGLSNDILKTCIFILLGLTLVEVGAWQITRRATGP